MKKWIALFTSALLIIQTGLCAQEKSQTQPPVEEAPVEPVKVPGAAAAQSSQASSSTRQNWIFAGTALAIAVVGVVIVSLSSGKEAR